MKVVPNLDRGGLLGEQHGPCAAVRLNVGLVRGQMIDYPA